MGKRGGIGKGNKVYAYSLHGLTSYPEWNLFFCSLPSSLLLWQQPFKEQADVLRAEYENQLKEYEASKPLANEDGVIASAAEGKRSTKVHGFDLFIDGPLR